jgi:hypothetical protein
MSQETEVTKNEVTNPVTVEEVLRSVDWRRFNKLCSSLGSELNDQQWRFLKAAFLERAVSSYSNNLLVYVGDDKNGCDFIIPSLNNATVEMKFTAEALFNPKKAVPKDKCKAITLLNSKGTNTHQNLPESYAQHLLIVEARGAAFITKDKLMQYVVSNGDSLTAVIPTAELTFVFQPSDLLLTGEKETTALNIKNKFLSVIDDIINSV